MKNVVIFSDSMVKVLKMKQFNSHIHGKVYLKVNPAAKAGQLNHHVKPSLKEYKYDAAIIRIGINDILSKGENEVNDIPRKVTNIADTCRNYNIAKIFISSIVSCSRTTVDIDYINPNKAGLILTLIRLGVGGQFDPPSYFKKNLPNINITLHSC